MFVKVCIALQKKKWENNSHFFPIFILDVKHLNPMLDLFLKLCYTIIVPRERVPCKKTNALFNGEIGNCPFPCNKNLTKLPLDIKHKLCYNEYMKRTRKSP
jgi:hypothetical protein